jgi:hypothetical protein
MSTGKITPEIVAKIASVNGPYCVKTNLDSNYKSTKLHKT